jgi:hypothetical protein
MPGTPVLKQEAHSINGQQLLLSYYGLTRGPSDYAVVTLSGFNVPNWDVAHMLMLDLYRRFNVAQTEQSSSSFKATFQKDISLNGYAGRQFSLEADNRVGVWRIYEVNKTFYAVGGSSNSTYTYALRRFFESFSLSEDKPTVVSASKTEEKRASKTEEKIASNPTGRWLIILQTFSKNERAKAYEKMNVLKGQGYNTQVISTDSYSNLRPGLLVLAMGPFSKQAAQERLGKLRSVAPQSYIKAGW